MEGRKREWMMTRIAATRPRYFDTCGLFPPSFSTSTSIDYKVVTISMKNTGSFSMFKFSHTEHRTPHFVRFSDGFSVLCLSFHSLPGQKMIL